MTDSMIWTIVIFVVLLLWEIFMRLGAMPRDKQMPILLIMAGIMFSTMHQSSLGSLFLLAPGKLSVLWFTPILPILFFLSAVMVAPAMIVVESMHIAKADGHDNHFNLLSSFTRGLPWLLIIYLVVKLVDLGVRGAFGEAFAFDGVSISWLLEIIIGLLLPIIILLGKGAREKPGTLLFASWLVVIGLIWNRVNVSMVGMKVEGWETYIPAWPELFITIGVFSMGILALRYAGKYFPIHEH
jgi:Ni/Fe-hydrogenase subunit HybB-like protein